MIFIIILSDNGSTVYEYDNMNLVSLRTENLQNEGTSIDYTYFINRLIEIKYPNLPSGDPNIANTTYVYGTTGNKKGRLVTQQDASGIQEFDYGSMGEMTSNKRTIVGPNIPTREFTTYFQYDSWNRLQDMQYPDGERVSFTYDLGGNLTSMTGDYNGTPYNYIRRIDYDYFEQRTYLLYGNSTETTYTYSPDLRRMSNLEVKTSGSSYLFNNDYQYDKVGNVTGLNNSALVTTNDMAGKYGHTYQYDNLNRLTSAEGYFDGSMAQIALGNDANSNYNLSMEYNNTHGIVTKNQTHIKNGNAHLPNTYKNNYEYLSGTHKVSKITDSNTGEQEEFSYDLNGNMTVRSINEVEKNYLWDESNRLRVVSDQGTMQHYIYDASGERVLKANSDVEAVYENGSLLMPPGSVSLNGYTSYPSAFMVVTADGVYSKHYYAGSQRIVSRLGDNDASIFEVGSKGAKEASTTKEFDAKKLQQQQVNDVQAFADKLKKGKILFKEYKLIPLADQEKALEDDRKMDEDDNTIIVERSEQKAPPPPIYYYHPDHLGTSTALTDFNGSAYQFFLNLPFGETMAEQLGSNYYNTPYKFNGKELDEETGLYYYGARYYDPRISIWLSVDPLAEHSPDKTPYHYCSNNPINRTDPTGMCDDPNCTHSAFRRGWDSIGRFFGAWGHADKSTVSIGPLVRIPNQETAGDALPSKPFPWEVIKGGAESEAVATAVTGMSLSAGIALFAAGALAARDSRPKEEENNNIYLYRNMRRGLGGFGYFPELGASANSLGLRAKDVDFKNPTDILSSTFSNGLSTTIGNKNGPFGLVPNQTNKTVLFQLDVRSLGVFGLKLTSEGSTYGKITPARSMSVEEFNNQIQNTEGLWKQK